MSRLKATDFSLPSSVRVDKQAGRAGFFELDVSCACDTEVCLRCAGDTIGHGSRRRDVAHVVGDTPCTLHVKIERKRCKRCGCVYTAEIPFISRVCKHISQASEDKMLKLAREGHTVASISRELKIERHVVAEVADSVHIKQVHLPRILLMDEIHAYTCQDEDGKRTCVFWACAYDGQTGCLVDVIGGRDACALDRWFSQFEPKECMHVKFFCCDMYDAYVNAAKKYLPLACICIDKFHVAKDGVKSLSDVRRRIQKGAGNGCDIKRCAHKYAINRYRKRGTPGYTTSMTKIAKTLCICDGKHSEMRIAYLLLQLYYAWQDADWEGTREEADTALSNLVQRMKCAGIPEMKRFAETLSKYKQYIVSGYILGINTSKAERINADIKAMKRNSRGLPPFRVARKRLLLALGSSDSVEGATDRCIRIERAELISQAKRKHKRH